jgi:7-cyano-7-deazaguanine synthase
MEREMRPKAVVLLSGGLDSTTLFYRLAEEGYDLRGLCCDYGQRHRKEMDFARRTAARLGAALDIVDLTSLTHLLATSALTNPSISVPEGHYEGDMMKITVVPNRNAIMLTAAFGVAHSIGAMVVAAAVHSGDHAIYPDCRREFIERFQVMQDASLGEHVELRTPYLDVDKVAIAREAGRLGVPLAETWSCYKGDAQHCGRCGTCVERAWAITEAGLPDPTVYQDPGYWRNVMASRAAVAS